MKATVAKIIDIDIVLHKEEDSFIHSTRHLSGTLVFVSLLAGGKRKNRTQLATNPTKAKAMNHPHMLTCGKGGLKFSRDSVERATLAKKG